MMRFLAKFSRTQKALLLAGVLVVLLALVALVAVTLVAPGIARDMVEAKLARAEKRLGAKIETKSIDTSGLAGVEIHGLTITRAGADGPAVRLDTVGASLDTGALLAGDKVISSVWADGVDVYVTRTKGGGFDLVDWAREVRHRKGDGSASGGASGGILDRHFGGEFPDVDVENVRVHFSAADGAPEFPLKLVSLDTGEVDSDGDVATVDAKLAVASNPSPDWTIPKKIDLHLVVDDDLKPREMHLSFDRALELGGVEPYPFLRGGLSGVDITPERRVELTDVHFGFQYHDGKGNRDPFLDAKKIAVQVTNWSLNPSRARPREIVVDSPTVTVHYGPGGASALTDLDNVFRAPQARRVVAKATSMATKIHDSQSEPEPEDPDAVSQKPTPPPAKSKPSLAEKLARRAPTRIVVENAAIHMTDERQLPLVHQFEDLELDGGKLEFVQSAEDGEFKVDMAFKASGDGEKRGDVHALIDWQLGKKAFDADVNVDALDLSWLAQLLGPSVADNVRGGVLRAKFGVKPLKGKGVSFKGMASVENLAFYWDRLAEEPVENFTASYSVNGKYLPDAKMPEPTLLKTPIFKDDDPNRNDPKYEHGAFIIDSGKAHVGDVEASVGGAVYGVSALPHLPGRLDVDVDLAQTPVQKLFDAVPAAIVGPLKGTKLAGDFAWKLHAEVPLHRAGDMQWNAQPQLTNFDVVEMPKPVDPRNLMTGFQLTIEDEFEDPKKPGETVEFSRTVKIPRAYPVPARWLVDNAEIELEKLDERRRKREWPPIPDPRDSYLPGVTLQSPEYWYTNQAEQLAAPKPWHSDVIMTSDEQPLGPYVFVPLPYITPYLTRAIMTTEDNSFMKHGGFNWSALKESVEDNIEAQRFRRGASTISMQLVKNAFLDQQKLLARKLREVFIVWLMESVFDIPKARILEVYFNIIEFGPGIYGIHDAAVHYFGKRPDKLTLDEVAWLVSIIPNPKKYHFYYERGAITDRWFYRMKRYIRVMYNRERITAKERAAAMLEPPEFYKPKKGEPVLRQPPLPTPMEKYGPTLDMMKPEEVEQINDMDDFERFRKLEGLPEPAPVVPDAAPADDTPAMLRDLFGD